MHGCFSTWRWEREVVWLHRNEHEWLIRVLASVEQLKWQGKPTSFFPFFPPVCDSPSCVTVSGRAAEALS